MPRFPPYVEEKLRAIGWFPGRDISADFRFSPKSRLFPASIAVYAEFGNLTITKEQPGLWSEKVSLFMDLNTLSPDSPLEAEGYFGVPCAKLFNIEDVYLEGFGVGDQQYFYDAFIMPNGQICDNGIFSIIAPSFDNFLCLLFGFHAK